MISCRGSRPLPLIRIFHLSSAHGSQTRRVAVPAVPVGVVRNERVLLPSLQGDGALASIIRSDSRNLERDFTGVATATKLKLVLSAACRSVGVGEAGAKRTP